MNFKKVFFWGILIILVGLLVYQIPAVKYRLGWRLDGAQAYVRALIDPVEGLPTSIPQVSPNMTSTPLPSPTATVTISGPTPTSLPSPTPLPKQVTIESVEWERQDWNNCGPATLSSYLKFYGWDGDQFDISDLIKPIRVDRNVNVEELVHYARNNAGWLNTEFRVGGSIDLIKTFIANGIPVMIEEGDLVEDGYWFEDDLWTGHYLLITSYDEGTQSFTAQDSFRGPDRTVSYEKTDERWEAYNRVYILIFPPNKEERVKEILGEDWDEDINRQNALSQAQEETIDDPENAFGWFNLGSNLVYYERYEEAANAFDVARELGLPQRMLRYQFGPFFAYFHSNRNKELEVIVDYALQITPNSEEALLWKGWLLYRQGDSFGAIEAFREAYEANVFSTDAQYALDFMGVLP